MTLEHSLERKSELERKELSTEHGTVGSFFLCAERDEKRLCGPEGKFHLRSFADVRRDLARAILERAIRTRARHIDLGV